MKNGLAYFGMACNVSIGWFYSGGQCRSEGTLMKMTYAEECFFSENKRDENLERERERESEREKVRGRK
jgi:hypothetical protein